MYRKHHGLVLKTQDSGIFYFGTLRLLHWLSGNFHLTKSSSRIKKYNWDESWIDGKFIQATIKFQDSFWKFDRAAEHFEKCSGFIKENQSSKDPEKVAEISNALSDISLYLDSMLFYLRIQADCLANIVPNLYGVRGQTSQMARDSFRDQINWFTKKLVDFDPKYTMILENYTEWFKTLAGEKHGQGLRDIAAHRRGTYQFSWRIPDESADFQFQASMINDSGILSNDVASDLKDMVASYFEYLDNFFEHYVSVLRKKLDDESILSGPSSTEYFRFEGSIPNQWIYPSLQITNSE